jgi:hypothetical protein
MSRDRYHTEQWCPGTGITGYNEVMWQISPGTIVSLNRYHLLQGKVITCFNLRTGSPATGMSWARYDPIQWYHGTVVRVLPTTILSSGRYYMLQWCLGTGITFFNDLGTGITCYNDVLGQVLYAILMSLHRYHQLQRCHETGITWYNDVLGQVTPATKMSRDRYYMLQWYLGTGIIC